ncbi:hypothetical protein BDV95DRAFT_246342 [Massariosphaeria phaeospora]|uniref:Uncharacterized protein n=1 Tax=Massariosphaeria phaeospora TaxID=100035 RepID=A0A7C8I1Q7_9PLEO|nr:hypothetical protein BDV95DRAFT_246342 [Massariosphaeria phaeospora]
MEVRVLLRIRKHSTQGLVSITVYTTTYSHTAQASDSTTSSFSMDFPSFKVVFLKRSNDHLNESDRAACMNHLEQLLKPDSPYHCFAPIRLQKAVTRICDKIKEKGGSYRALAELRESTHRYNEYTRPVNHVANLRLSYKFPAPYEKVMRTMHFMALAIFYLFEWCATPPKEDRINNDVRNALLAAPVDDAIHTYHQFAASWMQDREVLDVLAELGVDDAVDKQDLAMEWIHMQELLRRMRMALGALSRLREEVVRVQVRKVKREAEHKAERKQEAEMAAALKLRESWLRRSSVDEDVGI